jgi:hypothetical protein
MVGDQTVVAQFDIAPDLVTLRVDKSGPGNGMVTSDPAGVACLPTCVIQFVRNTTVTLTPIAGGDSKFDEWRGGVCDHLTGPCTLLMDQDRGELAWFVEAN